MLIQFADLVGAWGVSFLIVLFNVAVVEWMAKRGRIRPLVIAGMCMAGALGYGAWRIPQAIGTRTVRVALVQGNIPQEEKWDAAFQRRIQERYASLTRDAAVMNPDLIVWPETAVPGFLGVEEDITRPVTDLARSVRRPLLVGAPVPAFSLSEGPLLNSAFLIEASGRLSTRHDKLHLVPFGEFIPGESLLPWLRLILPPIGAFVPGHSYTVFHSQSAIRNSQLSFSVLICFEDIFPELARHFVQAGAQMLLVITNDAWFGPTAAAYQHAQASTFRAVELRVPVARAANTGWSGFIDPSGRWLDRVHDASGRELFVPGMQTCDVPLGTADSVYRRWGDWFAWLCFAVALLGIYRSRSDRSR